MKIKKGIFTFFLTLITSVVSFAQFSHCKVAEIEELKKDGTVVVGISNDETTNQEVQEIMKIYWTTSKFKVIKRSELAEYVKANPANYVLTYIADMDAHNFNINQTSRNLPNGNEVGKIQFMGDCLILAKNLTKSRELNLTDAMTQCYVDFELRIVNEKAEFMREVGAINSILTFPNLQDSLIGKWKIPTINQKAVIEKELWIADVDLNKKELEANLKAAYFPYQYKIVSKGEIAKAIIEKRKDIVYLAREEYKLGVNLFLIHSPENNNVLFFTKGEGRFDAKGFEKIKSNKPHEN
jgi:hypothetical protein